jgi:hypothetical protein
MKTFMPHFALITIVSFASRLENRIPDSLLNAISWGYEPMIRLDRKVTGQPVIPRTNFLDP